MVKRMNVSFVIFEVLQRDSVLAGFDKITEHSSEFSANCNFLSFSITEKNDKKMFLHTNFVLKSPNQRATDNTEQQNLSMRIK